MSLVLLLSFFSYDLNLQKKCYAEAKECFGDAQSLKETFNCAKQLGKCLQNGAPTTLTPMDFPMLSLSYTFSRHQTWSISTVLPKPPSLISAFRILLEQVDQEQEGP